MTQQMDRFGLYPAPEGLPESFAGVVPAQSTALGAVLAHFDRRVQTIAQDRTLTADGKRTAVTAEQRAAHAAIDQIERAPHGPPGGRHSLASLEADDAQALANWRAEQYRRPEGMTEEREREIRGQLLAMEKPARFAFLQRCAERGAPDDLEVLSAARHATAVAPVVERDALKAIDEIQRDSRYPAAREGRKRFDDFMQVLRDNLWKAHSTIDGQGRVALPGAPGGRIVW
jgi:hypothetical protein